MDAVLPRIVTVAAARIVATALSERGSRAASVIIVTRNQRTFLELTLGCLARQWFPAGAWEVIVVDEASSDGTVELLDGLQRCGRLAVVKKTVPVGGWGASVNEGLLLAQGRIVVLLGAERLVGPLFLISHLFHHVREPGVVVGGGRRWVHTHLFAMLEGASPVAAPRPALRSEDLEHPEKWADQVFDDGMSPGPLFRYFTSRGATVPFPWVHFDCGNASLPRQVVLEIGRFDEGLPGWELGSARLIGREFAYRAYRQGMRFHFEPRAGTLRQVQVPEYRTRADTLRSLGYFFSRHPELDRTILEPILLGGEGLQVSGS